MTGWKGGANFMEWSQIHRYPMVATMLGSYLQYVIGTPRPLARQKQKRILPLRWICCIYLANWTNFEFDWNRGNRPTIMYVDKTYRLRWGSRVSSILEVETRLITLGTYQIKIAKSYTHEHINEDGSYEIHVNKDIENVDSARIETPHFCKEILLSNSLRRRGGAGVIL